MKRKLSDARYKNKKQKKLHLGGPIVEDILVEKVRHLNNMK